ncbi:hypothetical protein Pan97_00470 [Bremerella volcania]|uniref:DUF2071 domain-containing protein n=1 Tax=Bremerella volcania TaxID=2527984 RepID=A0A518C1I4_9BACT|nr:DUF2071 domain-containing protein [Bremerella volcania]QDU73080.1 hypothetical protein Pan97_00470 [Bremerella volcania]
MRLPVIRGIIDRRILANYRIDPDVLAKQLPKPFRPQVVNGFGIAGICLIRLVSIRPKTLPLWMGISSENAAHRIAVEWDDGDQMRTGVYIPRRDTSSFLNALAGGRIFPGVHHRAKFEVSEQADHYRIRVTSHDRQAQFLVAGRVADDLSKTSIFHSVEEVSHFFECGSIGYSPANKPDQFDGLELRSFNWQVTPLDIEHVESSFFDNANLFPPGTAVFDNALLMRSIDHEWHERTSMQAKRDNVPSITAQCETYQGTAERSQRAHPILLEHHT